MENVNVIDGEVNRVAGGPRCEHPAVDLSECRMCHVFGVDVASYGLCGDCDRTLFEDESEPCLDCDRTGEGCCDANEVAQ